MKKRNINSDPDKFKKIKQRHYDKLLLPNDDPNRLRPLEVLLISFISSDSVHYKISKNDYAKKTSMSNHTISNIFETLVKKGYLNKTTDGYIFYDTPEDNPVFNPKVKVEKPKKGKPTIKKKKDIDHLIIDEDSIMSKFTKNK